MTMRHNNGRIGKCPTIVLSIQKRASIRTRAPQRQRIAIAAYRMIAVLVFNLLFNAKLIPAAEVGIYIFQL